MTWLLSALLAATPVELEVEGCPVEPATVKHLAELELQRGPPVALRVRLLCADGRLDVQVDDPVTQKTLSRALRTEDLTLSAPERFAALALVELVEASWSEFLLPPSQTRATAPSATQEVRRAAVERIERPRVRLGVAGVLRGFPRAGLLLGGGAAWVDVRLMGRLAVRLELEAETGAFQTSEGRVNADVFGGALFLATRVELGRLLVGGGLGFRGGFSRLVGVPNSPSQLEGRTLASVLAGPAAMGHFAFPLWRLEVSVSLETGFAPWGLVGQKDGAPLVTLGGWWLSGLLGLGARF